MNSGSSLLNISDYDKSEKCQLLDKYKDEKSVNNIGYKKLL